MIALDGSQFSGAMEYGRKSEFFIPNLMLDFCRFRRNRIHQDFEREAVDDVLCLPKRRIERGRSPLSVDHTSPRGAFTLKEKSQSAGTIRLRTKLTKFFFFRPKFISSRNGLDFFFFSCSPLYLFIFFLDNHLLTTFACNDHLVWYILNWLIPYTVGEFTTNRHTFMIYQHQFEPILSGGQLTKRPVSTTCRFSFKTRLMFGNLSKYGNGLLSNLLFFLCPGIWNVFLKKNTYFSVKFVCVLGICEFGIEWIYYSNQCQRLLT